jgi:hypothetical protein
MHGRTVTTEKNGDCVLDYEQRKDTHESTGESMTNDDLQHCLDLRWADLDPELFAAAAVHYMGRLIATGGGSVEQPDEEEALYPYYLKAFLAHAVETAHKTRRFEQEWGRVHRLMPQIQAAWERGQALFQDDVVRATCQPEEMEYLSHLDFAQSCYAEARVRKAYPHERLLLAWATNGYMLAWWQHFLTEEDTSV